MSATLAPPVTVETPPAVRAPEVVTQPTAAPSRVARSSPAGGQIRNGLFFVVWVPAMIVAGVAAAVVFAIGSPIAAATVEYRRRQYR